MGAKNGSGATAQTRGGPCTCRAADAGQQATGEGGAFTPGRLKTPEGLIDANAEMLASVLNEGCLTKRTAVKANTVFRGTAVQVRALSMACDD